MQVNPNPALPDLDSSEFPTRPSPGSMPIDAPTTSSANDARAVAVRHRCVEALALSMGHGAAGF